MIRLDSFIPALQPDFIVRSALLAGALWLAAFALRKSAAPAATRHLVWLCGMAGLLLLPVLTALLPELPLPLLRGDGAQAGGAAVHGSAAAVPDETAAWWTLLSLCYLVVAGGLVARLVHARRTLARLWSAAQAMDSAREEALAAHGAALRLRRSVGLRTSERVAVPMTWGTFAPKVLLPAGALRWPAERLDLVLLHELAHVARKDALSQCAASIACAVYWFNPAVWLAAREMRVEQEKAADDLVLNAGADPLSYANCLFEVARAVAPRSPAVHAAATAGRSQLERRLAAIVGAARRDRAGWHSAAFGAGVLISTWFVSTALPVPAAASSSSAEKIQAARPAKDGRSYTAIGSAPPEAAGPGEKRGRMPAEANGATPSGPARAPVAEPARKAPEAPPRPAAVQKEEELRPQGGFGQAQHVRGPLPAAGTIPPSRSGLAAIPPAQPLSPTGIPRLPRLGEGPLPPSPGWPP